MGGLFVVALLLLILGRALPAAVRTLKVVRAEKTTGDRAARLLALAVRGLPADRAAWGRAMLVELDEAQGAWGRWRFTLGCARATTAIRIRASLRAPGRGGAGIRTIALGAVAAALVLAAYGLVRYPGLRVGVGNWAAAGTLLVLLAGYALAALTLSAGTTPEAVTARRHGLLGGLAVGAAWSLVLAPTPALRGWVALPLAVALLAPASVAVFTAHRSRNAKAGTSAALWSGLIGGLLIFAIWVTATYLRDGRPYDPQLIRDFHHSGAHDLATYAVSDNLGAALTLLLIVPTIALAAGSLAAQLTAKHSR